MAPIRSNHQYYWSHLFHFRSNRLGDSSNPSKYFFLKIHVLYYHNAPFHLNKSGQNWSKTEQSYIWFFVSLNDFFELKIRIAIYDKKWYRFPIFRELISKLMTKNSKGPFYCKKQRNFRLFLSLIILGPQLMQLNYHWTSIGSKRFTTIISNEF